MVGVLSSSHLWRFATMTVTPSAMCGMSDSVPTCVPFVELLMLPAPLPPKRKMCAGPCHKSHLLSYRYFYRDSTTPDGFSGWCISCIKEQRRKNLQIDHECRNYSFIFQEREGEWVCPICSTPYSVYWRLRSLKDEIKPFINVQYWKPWKPLKSNH